MLCAPPFIKANPDIMKATLFNAGAKENASIFSHTQSWGVIAEVMQGDGDQAYAYYRAFMPAAYNDRAEVRQIEPYVHCQMTYSRYNINEGASRTPWLSGTASWSYYTATHWILGVRPEIDGLRIDPCIPKSWPGFSVRRTFRGKTLDIEVRNPDGVSMGVRSLTIDWFDHWLNGKDTRIASSAPVRIFVMGTNKWLDDREWPPERARARNFYLASQGRANTASGDGALDNAPPRHAGADR